MDVQRSRDRSLGYSCAHVSPLRRANYRGQGGKDLARLRRVNERRLFGTARDQSEINERGKPAGNRRSPCRLSTIEDRSSRSTLATRERLAGESGCLSPRSSGFCERRSETRKMDATERIIRQHFHPSVRCVSICIVSARDIVASQRADVR